MEKVNLDDCYLVLISRLIDRKKVGEEIIDYSKKVKFTIVESKQGQFDFGYFQDVFGNEIYKIEYDNDSPFGTLVINDKWYILPVRSLVGENNQCLKIGTLAKKIREPIIKLNKLLYSDEEDKIFDLKFIYELFDNNSKNKQKKIGIRRIKK